MGRSMGTRVFLGRHSGTSTQHQYSPCKSDRVRVIYKKYQLKARVKYLEICLYGITLNLTFIQKKKRFKKFMKISIISHWLMLEENTDSFLEMTAGGTDTV